MIMFIHGLDTYSSHQYLETIINQFKQKYDQAGQAIIFFTEESGGWEDLAQQLTSSDLFASKKMIVARDILDQKDVASGLLEFLENSSLSDDTTFVIYQTNKADARLKLTKKLLAGKFSKEFKQPSLDEVEQFIKDRARACGKKIDSSAVRVLCERVGANLWRASAEIDKLVFSAGETINTELVREIVQSDFAAEIWPLVDAIAIGNKKEVLQFFEQQIINNAEPLYLLTMIIRQIRLLLTLHGASESDSELASNLSLHPFVVKKTRQQARHLTIDKLKVIYQALLRLDLALKTGRKEPKALFTILLDSIAR